MGLFRKEKRTQFAVLGIGRFGSSLAQELYGAGNDVLVIDNDENKINNISDKVTHAIIADITDDGVLENAGIKNMDVVIICIGSNMQSSILATLACKDLGVPYVVCKANSDKHKEILEKLGADAVVVPEVDMAKKLAVKISNPVFYDIMTLTEDYSIIEINVPEKWIGKSLQELDIRNTYGVNIMLIKGENTPMINPSADYKFVAGDVAVVGSDIDNIKRFTDKLN